MYKLVALDLDGTLLTPKKNISEYNKRVVDALSRQGIQVIIATGRTFTAAYHYYLELGLKTPMISCNGGFIYDPINQNTIHGQPIDSDSLTEIIDELDELGVYYQYYTAQTIYTKRIAFLTEEWTEKNKCLQPEAKINIEVVADPKTEIRNRNEVIYKVLLTDEREEVREKIWRKFAQNPNLELVVSVGQSIDIMAKGITKGNALRKLANYMEIPVEATISMGDNHNDVSMIEAAGLGIAMDNAEPEVKMVASSIAKSNSEDGVGKMLNELFDLQIKES